jgi:hypothetical protein
MIILLPLLRKLSIHQRTMLGRALVIAGVIGLLVGFAAVPALVVVSGVSIIVGGVSLASAWSGRRAARSGSGVPGAGLTRG